MIYCEHDMTQELLSSLFWKYINYQCTWPSWYYNVVLNRENKILYEKVHKSSHAHIMNTHWATFGIKDNGCTFIKWNSIKLYCPKSRTLVDVGNSQPFQKCRVLWQFSYEYSQRVQSINNSFLIFPPLKLNITSCCHRNYSMSRGYQK